MSEWQPIKTAPRDRTRVLVTWSGTYACSHHVRVACFDFPEPHSKKRAWCGDGEQTFGNQLIRPTHWMPLPEPPKP